MKMCQARILLVFLLLLIGVGCSEKTVSSAVVGEKGVIAVVNNHVLTESNRIARVEMMVQTQLLANPKLKKKVLKQWRKQLSSSYPDYFVKTALYEDYAREQKIVIPEDVLRSSQSNIVARLGCASVASWEDLLSKLGASAPALKGHVHDEALRLVVERSILAANPTNVTEEVYRELAAKGVAYNESMALSNAVTFAQATNVWGMLKGGQDFGELAQRYSTIKQERKDKGDWAVLDWAQFEGEAEMLAWAKKLEPGQYSPPIEGDNGLMILRVDRKDEKECKMSRIYFRLPRFMKIETYGEFLAQVKALHTKKVLNRAWKQMKSNAKIEMKGKKKK